MRTQILQNSHTMKKQTIKRILKVIIILLVIFYFLTGYAKGLNIALELQHQEQALEAHTRLVEAMEVPELIEYLAPENSDILKRLAWCESSYNNSIIHYNDGKKGSHSYYLFQFKVDTWNEWEKKFGEDLNIESAYDQIKLTNFMLEKGQAHQWGCIYFKKV